MKHRAHCVGKYKFELGKYYQLSWLRSGFIGRFIQVTPKGYNFLNEETNRCLLKTHLYVPKKLRDASSGDEKSFLI